MEGTRDTHPPAVGHPPAADHRLEDGLSPAPAQLSSILSSPARTSTQTYTGPDATTDITHLYLTFTTPLPKPNTTIRHPSPSPQDNNLNPPPPPPPPDLTPYSNPLTWPNSRKYLLLTLSCIATWLTAYTAGSYSPPQHLIQASLAGNPSTEAVLTGITTFCMGFALAPMVLAPLSEMNGRYPVFVVAGVVFVVFQAVCGVVGTLEGMLVARFFVGAGASVFSTMVGGVIADMWDSKGRNTPMAVFSGSVLAGTGAGPLVGAVMAERMGGEDGGWKWIFWHQVVMGGVMMVLLVVFFRESRGSVLLSRKAGALNKWYGTLEAEGYFGVWDAGAPEDESLQAVCGGDEEKGSAAEQRHTAAGLKRIRWLVKEDEERASLGKMIATSVSRPFHLLFTEPVVFFFSLWVAFAWGILYLTFGSIPLVFQRVYGWSLEEAGYVFVALIIGAILATAIGIGQERILDHPKWADLPLEASSDSSDDSSNKTRNPPPTPAPYPPSGRIWVFLRRRFPASSPDSRLYFTCLTSTLLPIGLFIFGFTARPDTHWIAPAIGLVLATMGILLIYLAVFNYFADIYHMYASSALAAQSFCRNVLAGAFPLVTRPLFTNLGEARAGGLLGAIATALTVVPWVLVFFGGRIRARSPFASQLDKT
ncbi:major facilitator superfamily domain-containing protein [Chaetomidium leptoderma]|uniref:Major facilitator superfamily domain-containing protein n=1 Tax=Chaetomidium leptoderma TaxID=669021 RepID=A0AAN6VMC5_9PEZI|nr:major facilitator superfamily domain-containing protein [Chaetomidium leptoderma]